MQTRTLKNRLVRSAAVMAVCALPTGLAATSHAANPVGATQVASEATPSSAESEVLRLVNVERAKENLQPLTFDSCLYGKAKAWSGTMSSTGDFKHQDLGDISKDCPGNGTLGENIAAGQSTPEEVVEAWMQSPGHRANILNANFTKLGVGETDHYWTQDFAG